MRSSISFLVGLPRSTNVILPDALAAMPASMKPMSGSLISATRPLKWLSKSAAHESSLPPTSFSLYPNESELWLPGIIVSQFEAPVAKFFFELSRKIFRNGASP